MWCCWRRPEWSSRERWRWRYLARLCFGGELLMPAIVSLLTVISYEALSLSAMFATYAGAVWLLAANSRSSRACLDACLRLCSSLCSLSTFWMLRHTDSLELTIDSSSTHSPLSAPPPLLLSRLLTDVLVRSELCPWRWCNLAIDKQTSALSKTTHKIRLFILKKVTCTKIKQLKKIKTSF